MLPSLSVDALASRSKVELIVPWLGLMVNFGTGAEFSLTVTPALSWAVLPPELTTTVLGPGAVCGLTLIVTSRCPESTTCVAVGMTPAPRSTLAPFAKPTPLTVKTTDLLPRPNVLGATESTRSEAAGGGVTPLSPLHESSVTMKAHNNPRFVNLNLPMTIETGLTGKY